MEDLTKNHELATTEQEEKESQKIAKIADSISASKRALLIRKNNPKISLPTRILD